MKKLADTGLIDILIFSLAFITFIIGLDQSVRYGIVQSYWLFTICIFCLLFYNFRKQRRMAIEEKGKQNNQPPIHKSKKKK